MKKDFWNRWLKVFALSVPTSAVSVILAFLLKFPEEGFLGLTPLIIGSPIINYGFIFALSIWICKANIVQAVIVAATSPLSIVAHGWFIFLAGMDWGIW
ncbi:MAG: hypothetical protein FWH04_06645 [Oscillospiraceae bacterium]|nr:hypothetical protein [Oscillospiraceae bacterium]